MVQHIGSTLLILHIFAVSSVYAVNNNNNDTTTNAVDMIFLIAIRGNVSLSLRDCMINFTLTLPTLVNINKDEANVAVGDSTTIKKVGLRLFNNANKYVKYTKGLDLNSKDAAVPGPYGLQSAMGIFAASGRPNVTSFLVLITDASPSPEDIQEANALLNQNVTIYVIYLVVGDNDERDKMKAIVRVPADIHIVNDDDNDDLCDMLKKVVNIIYEVNQCASCDPGSCPSYCEPATTTEEEKPKPHEPDLSPTPERKTESTSVRNADAMAGKKTEEPEAQASPWGLIGAAIAGVVLLVVLIVVIVVVKKKKATKAAEPDAAKLADQEAAADAALAEKGLEKSLTEVKVTEGSLLAKTAIDAAGNSAMNVDAKVETSTLNVSALKQSSNKGEPADRESSAKLKVSGGSLKGSLKGSQKGK